MVPTDFPDPDAPEFAVVRGELARLFIEHKADMGMGDHPDAYFVEHVNDVAATLVFLSVHALDHGDEAWLARHEWFRQACNRLDHDQPAVKLDG
jgi:hypothetical protein